VHVRGGGANVVRGLCSTSLSQVRWAHRLIHRVWDITSQCWLYKTENALLHSVLHACSRPNNTRSARQSSFDVIPICHSVCGACTTKHLHSVLTILLIIIIVINNKKNNIRCHQLATETAEHNKRALKWHKDETQTLHFASSTNITFSWDELHSLICDTCGHSSTYVQLAFYWFCLLCVCLWTIVVWLKYRWIDGHINAKDVSERVVQCTNSLPPEIRNSDSLLTFIPTNDKNSLVSAVVR